VKAWEINPRIREEAMEGKKRRLQWWRSNKWPKSDAQTWKQKKTRNEELIGNSRPSLKKSPCDEDSQELICQKRKNQKHPQQKGMTSTEIATLQTRRRSLARKLKLNREITGF
jgi:hypothetical protein